MARLWSGSPGATVLAFKLLAGLAAAGAALLAAGAARRWGLPERQALAVSLVALNPVIVVHTVGGGHNDALIALALAGAAWLAAPGPASKDMPAHAMWHDLPVTTVLTLASLVKVVAAIPLLLWWWSIVRAAGHGARLRRLAPHLALAAGLTAVLSVPLLGRMAFGVRRGEPRLTAGMGQRGAADRPDRAGPPPPRRRPGRVWSHADALRRDRVDPRSIHAGSRTCPVGTGAVLFALFAPYVLPWYVAWFVPLLALVDEVWLVRVGVALGCLLALTGVPAEPDGAAWLWRDMTWRSTTSRRR